MGTYREAVVGFHSRASVCASAICAGVILVTTLSRFLSAPLSPLAAAKLNHMCALTDTAADGVHECEMGLSGRVTLFGRPYNTNSPR
jgi:hypothetical protein